MFVINVKVAVINVVQISDIYIIAYLLGLLCINVPAYTCSSRRHDCKICLIQRNSGTITYRAGCNTHNISDSMNALGSLAQPGIVSTICSLDRQS